MAHELTVHAFAVGVDVLLNLVGDRTEVVVILAIVVGDMCHLIGRERGDHVEGDRRIAHELFLGRFHLKTCTD